MGGVFYPSFSSNLLQTLSVHPALMFPFLNCEPFPFYIYVQFCSLSSPFLSYFSSIFFRLPLLFLQEPQTTVIHNPVDGTKVFFIQSWPHSSSFHVILLLFLIFSCPSFLTCICVSAPLALDVLFVCFHRYPLNSLNVVTLQTQQGLDFVSCYSPHQRPLQLESSFIWCFCKTKSPLQVCLNFAKEFDVKWSFFFLSGFFCLFFVENVANKTKYNVNATLPDIILQQSNNDLVVSKQKGQLIICLVCFCTFLIS